MLHELKNIVRSAKLAQQKGIKTCLASVVSLDGSSYRRPGVRMSIQSDGKMIGAVSGGCVEKEVLRQAQSVFETNQPKLMVYDGRYRLGCEGILYILIDGYCVDVWGGTKPCVVLWAVLQLMYLVSTMTSKFLVCGR